MKMITKILTLALAAVLCVSTAGVTASGEMESQKADEKADGFFDDWGDDFPLPPEPSSVKLVNTRQWTVSGITSVETIYGNANISLFPGQTQEIIL